MTVWKIIAPSRRRRRLRAVDSLVGRGAGGGENASMASRENVDGVSVAPPQRHRRDRGDVERLASHDVDATPSMPRRRPREHLVHPKKGGAGPRRRGTAGRGEVEGKVRGYLRTSEAAREFGLFV